MNSVKSGFKTTEFWITLLVEIISIFVIVGVLTPEEGEALVLALSDAIVVSVALVAALAPLLTYIWGRVRIKSAHGGSQ